MLTLQTFAREGAKVFATDINFEKLKELDGKDGKFLQSSLIEITMVCLHITTDLAGQLVHQCFVVIIIML